MAPPPTTRRKAWKRAVDQLVARHVCRHQEREPSRYVEGVLDNVTIPVGSALTWALFELEEDPTALTGEDHRW